MLEAELGPIRGRRAEYARHMDEVERIVKAGTAQGREMAARTMDAARRAMRLDYF